MKSKRERNIKVIKINAKLNPTTPRCKIVIRENFLKIKLNEIKEHINAMKIPANITRSNQILSKRSS